LNDWNEHVAEAKLNDLRTDYFAKRKKIQVEGQGIFVVVKGKEGKWCKEWKKATSVHPIFKKTLIVF
jgi:hypothetical protein